MFLIQLAGYTTMTILLMAVLGAVVKLGKRVKVVEDGLNRVVALLENLEDYSEEEEEDPEEYEE